MQSAICVQAANASLGESPQWDTVQGCLYWVDINRPAIFRWDPKLGQTGHWPMPRSVGCVSTAKPGRLIFADSDGFGFLELSDGNISRTVNPESHLPQNRFNDGKVDRAGRFWAGTIDSRCIDSSGSLYMLDTDLSVKRMATGFICSNGLGWSPDNRIMYFTDSMARTIWSYEFDLPTGGLGPRRIFARLQDSDGVPDGLAVDSEGFVWSAIWDGWRLIRFSPDGSIEREVRLPVQRPTSCAFGGHDLKTLYITSACDDLSADALGDGPLAGAIFSLECKVPGIAEVPFGA